MNHIGKVTTAIRVGGNLCSTLTAAAQKFMSPARQNGNLARDNKRMARRTPHRCASTQLPQEVQRCERFLTVALHLVAQIPTLTTSGRQNLRQLVHDNSAAKARWRANASEMVPSSVLLQLHHDHLRALDSIARTAAAVVNPAPSGTLPDADQAHTDHHIFAAVDALDRTRRSIQNAHLDLTIRARQLAISQISRTN